MDHILTQLLPLLVLGAMGFGIATALSGWSIRLAARLGAQDRPNERSSHSEPTPRLGGIGLAAGILVPAAVMAVLYPAIQEWQGLTPIDPLQWKAFAGLWLATLAAFALGFWDDLGDPPALAKLAGQAVVAGVVISCGLVVRELRIPFAGTMTLPWPAGAALAFAWMVLAMNAVNFMDGANGIAGRFGEVLGAALAAYTLQTSWRMEVALLGGILFGASAGFLAWNIPSARTFLGDCGSQALGAFAGAVALLFANNDLNRLEKPLFDSFIGIAMVASPLAFDVLFTAARRAIRGENLLRPHREHLYQRYMQARGGSHAAALSLITGTCIATAVCGYVYAATRSADANPRSQALALACCAATLGVYWLRVRMAEKAASGPA